MQPIRVILGAVTLVASLVGTVASRAQPIISEFLADNQNGILDEDGEESDWIEIQLTGSEPLDLGGWFLTDDAKHQRLWRMPSRTLESGEFLLVFASGKDRTEGELHADFRLDSSGDYLALMEPDGSTVAFEFAPYPQQRPDISFGVGRGTIGDPLVAANAPAAVHVPRSDVLDRRWTGGNEPFDDSGAAGWFAATLGIGFPSDTAGVSADVPIAYWSFDSGTGDDSGNGNSAVAQGAVPSTDVSPAGIGGRSMRFDGVDDFVSAELDVSETQYTSSLWFKTSTASGGLFCVVQQDLGGGGHDRHVYLNGDNIATRVWNDETITSAGRDFVDGQWHHLAHIVSPLVGGQRIYVDGVQVASGSKSTSDFDWQERVNIGFSNDAANPHFEGMIDEVAIWSRRLSLQQIRALAQGALPSALAGVAPFVTSDIGDDVAGESSSVYVRVPFDLTAPLESGGLELRLRYEDAFVAYLNGVEVAHRNAPEIVAFDSVAVADRPVQQAVRVESVDLSNHLDALRTGRNVLAIHVINESAASGDLLMAPELVAVEESVDRFFGTPTPAGPNDNGVSDFVADTRFSIDRGVYDEPFDVEITTATEGATIWYTTDGSVPSQQEPNAEEYTGPIRVDGTTTLRAAAFREGFEPTNTDTHTYVFVDDTLIQPARPPGVPATWAGGFPADYGVDPDVVDTTIPGYSVSDALVALPTISVVTDPANLFDTATGIYANSGGRGPAWERPASVELIYPDGSPGFQIDAGIRMHGNSSRNHGFTPKHPIRVLFKRKYGATKLREKVFPDSDVDRFDQLLLRGASTDSWPVVDGGSVLGVQRWAARHATYMRDQWMRDAQNAMDRPSGHGIYVQLYLNGLYWGLYNFAERAVDSFNAEYFGGDKDEYDVIKDFAELQSGRRNAWDEMIQLANSGLSSNAAYQRIQGRDPDGTRNLAFPNYLDVDGLMDYMILHISSGAEDWPNHNWWAARRRGDESGGFRFFVWDQEISNDSLSLGGRALQAAGRRQSRPPRPPPRGGAPGSAPGSRGLVSPRP